MDANSQLVSSTTVSRLPGARRQGTYWIATIPELNYVPVLDSSCAFITGQLELGAGGFRHWQCFFIFNTKKSLVAVKRIFPSTGHYELTRSALAESYCNKEETRIEGTQFTFGAKPIRRNSKKDWEEIWDDAKTNSFECIPADIRVVHYRTLKQIAADNATPVAVERTVNVFWGSTGTGKSRRAWDEAGLDAYPKDPRTKFWCGYSGQCHVVIGN